MELLINRDTLKLDQDWFELVTEAKEIGLNKEEVKLFFQYEAWKKAVISDTHSGLNPTECIFFAIKSKDRCAMFWLSSVFFIKSV